MEYFKSVKLEVKFRFASVKSDKKYSKKCKTLKKPNNDKMCQGATTFSLYFSRSDIEDTNLS